MGTFTVFLTAAGWTMSEPCKTEVRRVTAEVKAHQCYSADCKAVVQCKKQQMHDGETSRCAAALCIGNGLAASGECSSIHAHEQEVCQAMAFRYGCQKGRCGLTSEEAQLSVVEDAETFELLGQVLETIELPAENVATTEAPFPTIAVAAFALCAVAAGVFVTVRKTREGKDVPYDQMVDA